MDFLVFRRMRRSHTLLHLPRWPRTLPGGGPAQAASARHGKDLQPVCQDHTEIRGGRKETWDTHVLLEPPGAHRAGGDRCLTATTPAEVQSSLRGDPTSWVGSSTLHAMRRETQLKRHESWQKEVYRVAESVGQAVEKAGAQKREFGGMSLLPRVSQEGQRCLLTGHHAMSLPARK